MESMQSSGIPSPCDSRDSPGNLCGLQAHFGSVLALIMLAWTEPGVQTAA